MSRGSDSGQEFTKTGTMKNTDDAIMGQVRWSAGAAIAGHRSSGMDRAIVAGWFGCFRAIRFMGSRTVTHCRL